MTLTVERRTEQDRTSHCGPAMITPLDHGIVAGRLVEIERDDSPRKYRLALAGEGDWTAAIPVRVHSPVEVKP